MSKETDPPTRQKMAEMLALPLREQLVQNATQMMTYLLQASLGTREFFSEIFNFDGRPFLLLENWERS